MGVNAKCNYKLVIYCVSVLSLQENMATMETYTEDMEENRNEVTRDEDYVRSAHDNTNVDENLREMDDDIGEQYAATGEGQEPPNPSLNLSANMEILQHVCNPDDLDLSENVNTHTEK